MKKNNSNPENKNDISTRQTIPQIEIIDLEHDDIRSDDTSVSSAGSKADHHRAPAARRRLPRFVNMHMLLILVLIVFVAAIFFKFRNWGVYVDLKELFPEGAETEEYKDVLDQILPLVSDSGEIIDTDGVTTILAFGNAPFADDRDSEDNLANIIAQKTGATVYNCSISGSYLAAQNPNFVSDTAPMDAYTFYWLVTLAHSGINRHYFEEAANVLGENTPPEAEEVVETLLNLDLNTVDVITLMYDASDYLMGHEMYNDLNNTDIQQFTGNMEAGLDLIQENYPNIRIIVMSPTYAYAVTEDGKYVSSDMYTYGQSVLSTYVIKQFGSAAFHGVTFVDNLYGTITEDNAKDYLTDNLHLNVKGRYLVADRFVYALNYYNQEE